MSGRVIDLAAWQARRHAEAWDEFYTGPSVYVDETGDDLRRPTVPDVARAWVVEQLSDGEWRVVARGRSVRQSQPGTPRRFAAALSCAMVLSRRSGMPVLIHPQEGDPCQPSWDEGRFFSFAEVG